ncbi:F0F1 ATP synthase subunit B [Tuberibacillus sp. Marseille-P3662]|uniref:F0F1 ATP synthase subunit B n=1 Tax=Tuberibacillus sp. Marseille-P3662 TaxID=1965358 RepID=UPI0020CB4896|nr:F0F1 ATP synthase subunit B [Tuberibacillus sp. Marseille-P3662]
MVHFEVGTFLFQIIIFLILLWLVSRFAMKPAMKVLKDRQDNIESQIKDAENDREEAAQLLQKQKEQLDQARSDAKEIIDRAKKQSESEAQQIIDDAKGRADRMVEQAKEEIDRERERAVASLRDEVADLSVILASRVLEKEVDAKDHEKEIDAFIREAGDRI